MKLKANLLLTQYGVDKIIDGTLVSSDDFVEFDAVRIKKDGEFLEISLLLDDEVACFIDEIMIVKDGWSIDIKGTIAFKVGVKIE